MRAIGLPSGHGGDHRCQPVTLVRRQRLSVVGRDHRRTWRGSGWSTVTPLARNSPPTALGEAVEGTLSDAGAVPAGSTARMSLESRTKDSGLF
jgi:hypothetical protein